MVNLLPNTNIFTQPQQQFGIADLISLIKLQNEQSGDQEARTKAAALSPGGGGGGGGGGSRLPPPYQPQTPQTAPLGVASGAPVTGMMGPGAPGQASVGYGGLAAPDESAMYSQVANQPSSYDEQYAAADKKFNLPPGTMKTMGWIESRHNPKARSGNSQYRGLMQIGYDEEKNYGAGRSVYDPDAAIDMAGKIASRNQFAFRQATNREPTAADLYLMHQQGAAGAMALLNNPDKPAWQVVRPFYSSDGMAKKVISGNGGDPSAPASQFVARWRRHFAPSQDSPVALQQAPSGKLSPEEVAAENKGRYPGASKVDSSGNEIVDKPGIQPVRMAGGGIVTEPTLAMIGENGPEAVVPLYNKDSSAGAKVWTKTPEQPRPVITVPRPDDEDPGLFKAYEKKSPVVKAPQEEEEDPGLYKAYEKKPSGTQYTGPEGGSFAGRAAEPPPSTGKKVLNWIKENPGHAALAVQLATIAPPLLGGALRDGAKPISYIARNPGAAAGYSIAASEIAHLLGGGSGSTTAKHVISTIEELMHAVGH